MSTIIHLQLSRKKRKRQMGQRKIWTPEEDSILRQLYETGCVKKWSRISEIMAANYSIYGRNGKQCRQRYHNHLKTGIRKERWSQEEEQKLVEFHSIHGNKWALIAKLITGRTENCVKNMFNSKFRKSVRLLNRFIYLYNRKTLKQIKLSFANRLSEFTEAAHKKSQNQRSSEENSAIQIKNKILRQRHYQVHELDQQEKKEVQELVEKIHTFKRSNHKHYRGNVLAKLRKQKIKDKDSRWKMEVEQNSSPSLKHPPTSEIVDSLQKIAFQQKHNKKQSKSRREEDFVQITKDSSENEVTPLNNRETEANSSDNMNKDGSLPRPETLESSFFDISDHQGLERPIQIENYIHNASPCGRYDEGGLLDWGLCGVEWRLGGE